jgi:hypothetical protein
MNTQNTSRRRGLIALMVVALLGIGLVLDLQFKGLVWQFAWSQTGEESILGQIRGLAELGGNLLRRAPQTDPYAPINHNDAPPFGINVFLQKEVEEDKIRAMLDMISEAGFYWLRQEFTWEDIEVDGRGQFTDSRNDFNGDGEPDTISSWDKYDRIVDLVEEFDLHLLVRLSNPPAWSRADNPDTLGGALAPPMICKITSILPVPSRNATKGASRTIKFGTNPTSTPNGAKISLTPKPTPRCSAGRTMPSKRLTPISSS